MGRQTNISDRKWIIIICVAIVLEVIWLLYDLQLISLPFLKTAKSNTNAVEAGHIIRSREDVKKRSADSLIWEPAKQNDVLYYRDSLLTLSQSSAVLYLKDQTELQMSENTLVTFEEPEAQSNAEIRLRFSKGDIKARNPYNISRIETADWVVNLEKGAEIALRKEDKGYEFEVLAGKATLDTENGKEELVDSKIIKLGDDKKIETIEKSLELKWSNPLTERIYTSDEKAKVAVEWVGPAQQIKISQPGENDETKTRQISGQTAELELEPGNYQIRLEDNVGLSSPKQIEVKKAPKIYLKKPLPRDRIAIGQPMEFIWEGDNSLKSYNLKLSNGQSYEVNENFKSLQFDKEQDIVWKIEAKDADGFRVPSLYESKVYLRNDALAAPKLKTPKLIDENESEKKREPNTDFNPKPGAGVIEKPRPTSYIWNPLLRMVFRKFLSFGSVAEAQVLRRKNVVFEWDAVEGANQYIIEISSDPEFKTPEVVETLNKTSYVWKKYDPKKTYYWRVASGNSNGRMGLFSDPVQLEVIVERNSPPNESNQPELSKTKPKKEVKVEEAKKADENQKPEDVSAKPTGEVAELERPVYFGHPQWRLAYAPGFKAASVGGDQNTKVELSGTVPLALDFQYRTDESQRRMYFSHVYFSTQKWKSKDTTGSVQQPDLNLTESFFSLRTGLQDSTWQYGVGGHLSFSGHKEGSFITSENLTFVGFEAAKVFSPDLVAEGAYMISGEFSEAKIAGSYYSYFSPSEEKVRYFYGFSLVSALQSGPYGSGHQSQIQFLFGIAGF